MHVAGELVRSTVRAPAFMTLKVRQARLSRHLGRRLTHRSVVQRTPVGVAIRPIDDGMDIAHFDHARQSGDAGQLVIRVRDISAMEPVGDMGVTKRNEVSLRVI